MGHEHTDGHVDRRDVIKKAAVAGGIAWTAPMIMSSRVSAVVGGTCPDPPQCKFWYMIRIDGSSCSADNSFPNNPGFGDPNCNNVLANVMAQLGGSVLTAPGGCSSIITSRSFGASSTSFTLKPGFKVKGVIFKDSNGCPSSDTSGACWTEGPCDSAGNRSITIGGCPGIQSSWSNVTAIVCTDTKL